MSVAVVIPTESLTVDAQPEHIVNVLVGGGDQGPAGADSGGTYGTIAAMTAASAPADGTVVTVRGYYTPGDGGGGELIYSALSVLTHDGALVFARDAGGTGRWLRILSNPDEIKAAEAGFKVNDSTADATNATRWKTFCPTRENSSCSQLLKV